MQSWARGKTTGMFTYVRRKPSLTGLTYKVWKSTDLVTWTQDTAATQTPVDSGDNQTVTVTLSGPKPLTAEKTAQASAIPAEGPSTGIPPGKLIWTS